MENQGNSTNSSSSENNIEELKNRAEQGDAEAQYDLALNYEQGWDVEQNNQKAVEWYTKAAENGCVMAQRRLASCYKAGILGLEKDSEKALYWLKKTGDPIEEDSIEFCKKGISAEQGHAEAKNKLPKAQYTFGRVYSGYVYDSYYDSDEEKYEADRKLEEEEERINLAIEELEAGYDCPEDRDDWDAEDYEEHYASSEPDFDDY